jgi:hypothetical protein
LPGFSLSEAFWAWQLPAQKHNLYPLQPRRIVMKVIIALALSAFLSLAISSSFTSAYAAAPGAMSGKSDWATRGYNQGAKWKQEQMKKGPKTAKPKPQ